MLLLYVFWRSILIAFSILSLSLSLTLTIPSFSSLHFSLSSSPQPEIEDMKAFVGDLLGKSEFDKKRSRTLDIDDFLRLLSLFNEKGLHFS